MRSLPIAEALPAEISRVRDEVIPAYMACGPGGAFAVAGMRADLDRASRAMIAGDIVEMLRVYQSLKDWQL